MAQYTVSNTLRRRSHSISVVRWMGLHGTSNHFGAAFVPCEQCEGWVMKVLENFSNQKEWSVVE
jgi:hypothetical protein